MWVYKKWVSWYLTDTAVFCGFQWQSHLENGNHWIYWFLSLFSSFPSLLHLEAHREWALFDDSPYPDCILSGQFICMFKRLIDWFLFFILFLPVLDLHCCVRAFSLAAASRGNSLVVVCRRLIVVASLFVAQGSRVCRLSYWAHRPSCSVICGIFQDQGCNPCSPALAGRFLTTRSPGKSFSGQCICFLLGFASSLVFLETKHHSGL